jgi:peptide/nickel transport system substrate-binding protein
MSFTASGITPSRQTNDHFDAIVSRRALTALIGPRDLGKVRSELQAAGYRGEKIVLIAPANLWPIKEFCDVAADTLAKVGMNVDAQVMDSATWLKRVSIKKPLDQGGWNATCANFQGMDSLSPACHRLLVGPPGWFDNPKIETLRDRWLDAPDVAVQRKIAAEIQAQAFIDLPYYPLGTFYPSTAYRSELTGVLDGQAIFWNVRRQG